MKNKKAFFPFSFSSLFPFSLPSFSFSPFSFLPLSFSPLSFFLFTFFLFTFFLASCSSPTETPKGSLTGTVSLEGLSDYSFITVALYNLAYLDTTIVRINNQYPQIGVHINQHTEFDHRLQSPIKSTETLADGSFELTKIPTGKYNLVAEKAGFGFKYLYEITIAEGENEISQARCHHFGRLSITPEFIEGRSEISELTPNSPLGLRQGYAPTCRSLSKKRGGERTHISVSSVSGRTQSLKKGGKLKNSERGVPFDPFPLSFCLEGSRTSDLTLYPETHISGNISDNITVLPDHHLIIDDDTVFIPNTSSLTIHPGAVIRINPGIDLTIHGNLFAQGEENNMFWITSNSGFAANERQKTKGKRQKVKYRNIEVIERNVNNSNSFFLPDHHNLGEGGSPLSFNLENRDSDILLYNSFELSSYASVSDDLIEWGKFSYGNSLNINIDHINFSNNKIQNSLSGIIIEGDDWIINNNLLFNISENRAINFNNSQDIIVEKNIIDNCYYSIELNNTLNAVINNNYINEGQKGILIYNMCDNVLVSYNQIEQFSAYCIEVYFYSYPIIEFNNINSTYGILNTEYTGCSSIPEIHNNNLNCSNIAIKNYGNCQVYDIPAWDNYFFSIDNNYIEDQLIWDYEDATSAMQANGLGHILFEPILNSIEINAGIK